MNNILYSYIFSSFIILYTRLLKLYFSLLSPTSLIIESAIDFNISQLETTHTSKKPLEYFPSLFTLPTFKISSLVKMKIFLQWLQNLA